jgi:hypothetical protein
MKSQLLDRGQGILTIYPQITVTNSRGDKMNVPSDVGYKLRVSMSRDRNASAELAGQVDVKMIRCLARSVPNGTWARVEYEGEEWDLVAPPHHGVGASKATRSVSFVIRSRNEL